MYRKFKVGDRVRRIAPNPSIFDPRFSYMKEGQEYEVTEVTRFGDISVKGQPNPDTTWLAKNFELLPPTFKAGDRVTNTGEVHIDQDGWYRKPGEFTGVITFISEDGEYLWFNNAKWGTEATSFKLVETPQIKVGDKGTIEVTVTHVSNDGEVVKATSGDYDEWCVRKENFTVTERAKPPKPKRERPEIDAVIKHGTKEWRVVNCLNDDWFTVRQLYTTNNFKLLHKNDPSWSF